MEAEIKAESNAILDAKLTDVADEAILAVRDRLKNGDFVLTKDGDISRVPVKARDASTIAKDMLTQRREIRLEKTERVESTTVDARLEKLMSEFIKFAKAKTIDGESTELQEGVRVISGNPGTDQESIGAEQSSPGVREEARGHQEGHRSQETAV